MQHTVVVNLPGEIEKRKDALINAGVASSVVTPKQAVWQLKSEEGTVTAYHSGKVVIQAKNNKWIERVKKILSLESSSGENSLFISEGEFLPHIGVDEAGKGDFFGPLVVGAVFVGTEAVARTLHAEGVKDSKMMSDISVARVAKRIRSLCPQWVEVVLNPVEYNFRYKKIRNANILLAQLHAQAIEELMEKMDKRYCTQVVIDQFSNKKSRVIHELLENGKKLDVKQMHRGEQDIAVAAASILARNRFIFELDELSRKYRMELPKGASRVIFAGKEFIKRYGTEKLGEVAKISFKTAVTVTSSFDI